MREGKQSTGESLLHAMLLFSVPYLISTFLQTLYGMADLFFVGQFDTAAVVTAVSVGSQVLHMLTVILVGLAMGTTVSISFATGAGDKKSAAAFLGNSITIFSIVAAGLTVVLLFCIPGILQILQVPKESVSSARDYLFICFLGIPFITFYNLIASIFRGLGDTTPPMIFVAIAGDPEHRPRCPLYRSL